MKVQWQVTHNAFSGLVIIDANRDAVIQQLKNIKEGRAFVPLPRRLPRLISIWRDGTYIRV